LEDEKSLVGAVKQVEVVICSIPSKHVLEQMVLIRVIKEAGCIKVVYFSLLFVSVSMVFYWFCSILIPFNCGLSVLIVHWKWKLETSEC